ncbi:hypothetical protein OE749_01315 [Aestuariibacter sp. AA17]|uniref:Uncharacterized protein n=1 Tax=Fluctibacter corallii TaxID=2984329 RepID=A0ABT3A3T1_9ALTE|nr:hypothetical protein [Aestuariibacter sp. AA17]MCV2883334.1 hypothetical protein [Aestuariibacter sp. AA17]
MAKSSDSKQIDIFSQDKQQLAYSQLCNALYERELLALAHLSESQVPTLQHKLTNLSKHVKRTADHLLNANAPINVDIHNASWQAKQVAKCPASDWDAAKTESWFIKHASMGIAVPVYVNNNGVEHIELDSIDRIDQHQSRLHCNKFRWFHFNGQPANESASTLKRVLHPTKSTMVAACCGHVWNHKGRAQPRPLTLRELLLSSTINWKTFR